MLDNTADYLHENIVIWSASAIIGNKAKKSSQHIGFKL